MRKFGVCLASIGVAVCLVGCGMQSGGHSSFHGGIAVVDLDKVAIETGKNIEMRETLQNQENAFKQELIGFRNNAAAQIQQKAAEIKAQGENATDEAKNEFLAINQKASNMLAQAQNLAGTKLNELQQVQIAKFRAELKPIIQEAASKRGLSVVIPKNDGLLLSVDPGVDITDEVIKAYQTKRPIAARVAPPQIAAPVNAQAAPKPTSKSSTLKSASNDTVEEESRQ